MEITKKEISKMAMTKKENARMETMWNALMAHEKIKKRLEENNFEKDRQIKKLKDEIFDLKNDNFEKN